jgi:hypothetical protein
MTWQSLEDELERWQDAGSIARLWLRDDDAAVPTLRLDDFAVVTGRECIPLLLAIIPARTGPALARHLEPWPHIHPAVHGWLHANHAPPGGKKQELGLHRGRDIVLGELSCAVQRMSELYGERLLPILVPPWNRIDAGLVSDLPALGYCALSTYGDRWLDFPNIRVVNTHVDLIDFTGTRQCHDHEILISMLAAALTKSRTNGAYPVGILSHHDLGDTSALAFIEKLFDATRNHPACRWAPPPELIRA